MTEILHLSDCSLHNEPAYPAGLCDCGAEKSYKRWWGCFYFVKRNQARMRSYLHKLIDKGQYS
jgi:hypothetical protein